MKDFPSKIAFRKMAKCVNEMDESIRSVIHQKKIDHHSKESYPYIPYQEEDLLYSLFKMMREFEGKYPSTRKFSLLDVGAGTGRIVKIAKECGIPAKGVEFHEPYVKLGRKFYELTEEELIVGNAFDLKNAFLKQFRVIYTYMPIRNATRMSALHFHLMSQAASGTTFLEMLPAYYPMYHFKMDRTIVPWITFTEEELDRMGYPFPGVILAQRGYNEWDEKEVD